jgi:hypothetical protein
MDLVVSPGRGMSEACISRAGWARVAEAVTCTLLARITIAAWRWAVSPTSSQKSRDLNNSPERYSRCLLVKKLHVKDLLSLR